MHKRINRKRIITVVGARPQFIKAFALSRALREASDVEEILIHTGQHFDDNMSDIFFDELGITPPQYHFTTRASAHGAATAHMLTCIEGVLLEENPDAVIVYGDTNSTLAGALAAAKLRLPLIHIEAGMRSFRRKMPEEINRVTTDHMSDVLLCSTRTAVQNLAREGITKNVHLVGDLMYDATLAATVLAEIKSPILKTLSLAPKSYAVATVHRARNTNDAQMLRRVLDFIADQAKNQPIVFPVHPRTAQAALRAGLDIRDTGAIVTEPLGYLDMCQLLHHASVIMTDSGGVQKEAYFHRVPCVTLRDVTEWVETIECGWNRLWTVGEYRKRQEIEDYGDGRAAAKIVEIVRSGVTRLSRSSV
jgi:UDP-GlcNAc3NAcA epimerase